MCARSSVNLAVAAAAALLGAFGGRHDERATTTSIEFCVKLSNADESVIVAAAWPNSQQ